MGDTAERRPARGGAPNSNHSNGTSITRETQLKTAIEKALLPARDYRVYHALLGRADWKTAAIPDKFQPRSLRDLARIARMSTACVCRSLNHLESHGWIDRERKRPGRGHATAYALLPGADCDCIPQRPEPVSDAERARRYRQRKKASHVIVTHNGELAQVDVTTGEKASQIDVTSDDKASQIDVTSDDKASQIDVTKRLASRDEDAGQSAFSAEEGRDVGEREEGWPEDSNGAEVNPWPAVRIPGVRGPIPDDPVIRKQLKVLGAKIGPVTILETINDLPR